MRTSQKIKDKINHFKQDAAHFKTYVRNNAVEILLGFICSVVIIALLVWLVGIPVFFEGGQKWAAYYNAGGVTFLQLQQLCLSKNQGCKIHGGNK